MISFFGVIILYYYIVLHYIALKNSDQLDSFPAIKQIVSVDLFVSVYVGKYCSLLVHINKKIVVI